MRIPHEIKDETCKCYAVSSCTHNLLNEISISVKAHNFKWEEVESLRDICIRVIAVNFDKCSDYYHKLIHADKAHVVELLSTDLRLELVVPLIQEDHYWKRRFLDKYNKITNFERQNSTWKTLYIERYIREVIEDFNPSSEDETDYESLIELVYPYIQTLNITQLIKRSREGTKEYRYINLIPFLSKFPNLTCVKLRFGKTDVGWKYKTDMLEVHPIDLENVAVGLCFHGKVNEFRCCRSDVRCEHIQLWCRKIINHEVLNDIDFSYCNIGNKGATCLAELIFKMKQLKSLNLRNNKIGAEGMKSMAYALMHAENCSLVRLDLSLNPLGDEGVTYLCSALLRSKPPSELSIRGIGMGENMCVSFATIMKYNTTLKVLDLSSNKFNDYSAEVLLTSLENNKTLTHLVMGEVDISEAIQRKIHKKVQANRVGFKKHLKEKDNNLHTIQSTTTFSYLSSVKYDYVSKSSNSVSTQSSYRYSY